MDYHQLQQINVRVLSFYQQEDLFQAQRLVIFALQQVRERANQEDDKDECPLYASIEGELEKQPYAVRPPFNNEVYEGIYTAAFQLTGDIAMSSAETASVLLFNLGLFQHIQGIKSNRPREIIKALSVYKKAFELLNMENRQDSVLLTIITAAVCINMAQIFRYLFDAQNSTSVMQCLEDAILCLRPEVGVVSKEDIDFFCSELYFARLDEVRFAPAA